LKKIIDLEQVTGIGAEGADMGRGAVSGHADDVVVRVDVDSGRVGVDKSVDRRRLSAGLLDFERETSLV
jgi:hypothetical protein